MKSFPTFSVRGRFALLFIVIAVAATLLFLHSRMSRSSLPPAVFVQTQGEIDSIKFSSDGRFLMTTDANKGVVTFRDATTGQILRQWPGGKGRIWLSQDGQWTLETDYLYSLRTFLPIAQIGQTEWKGEGNDGQIYHPLRWMAFDAQGHTLYGVPQNSADVLAWDIPTGL